MIKPYQGTEICIHLLRNSSMFRTLFWKRYIREFTPPKKMLYPSIPVPSNKLLNQRSKSKCGVHPFRSLSRLFRVPSTRAVVQLLTGQ